MKSVWFAVVLLALTNVLRATPLVLREKSSKEQVWVVSHRGDWQVAPENSLGALEAAIRAGVAVVETDVRLTQDGHAVILHDATLNRTTSGAGAVATQTLTDVQALRLRDALGTLTQERVPTLRDFFARAKGRVYLYLDKVGAENGKAIPTVLALAKEMDVLDQLIFVLDWPYARARAVFGDDLERVIYCPVITDSIPNVEAYVDEWLTQHRPFAFQFRFNTLTSQSYALLPKVIASGSRAFIAATWATHTASHDDTISLCEHPDQGWGWLIDQGFTLIETNHLRALLNYLSTREKSTAQ